jgi:hypothetical protein
MAEDWISSPRQRLPLRRKSLSFDLKPSSGLAPAPASGCTLKTNDLARS